MRNDNRAYGRGVNTERASLIHRIFKAGIYLKGLNGLLEVIGGTLLFFVHPDMLNNFVRIITQDELSEDAKDFIANYLVQSAHNLSLSSELFGGIFLLSHGLIKIGLIIALLKQKKWAYPLAIGVFGAFILYQMYRFSLSHSIWMIFLSVLDLFVIVLTYLEYRRLKAR